MGDFLAMKDCLRNKILIFVKTMDESFINLPYQKQ